MYTAACFLVDPVHDFNNHVDAPLEEEESTKIMAPDSEKGDDSI